MGTLNGLRAAAVVAALLGAGGVMPASADDGAPSAAPAPPGRGRAEALLEAVKDRIWAHADAYWHDGRYEDRIALDYLMIELEPRFLEPYSNASWLIDSNGRPKEAEALLRRATVACPDQWEAWLELGQFLHNKKRYVEATAALEKAIARPDCHPTAFHMLGHAYRLSGDLKKSLAAWEEALRREPGNGTVEANLRRVRELLKAAP